MKDKRKEERREAIDQCAVSLKVPAGGFCFERRPEVMGMVMGGLGLQSTESQASSPEAKQSVGL